MEGITLANVLENAQQVEDYLKLYLATNVVNSIGFHDRDIFVGRRRFAATLAEFILQGHSLP